MITRALGGPRLEPADFFVLPVTEVERLLLCSDGVSGLVDDDRIAAILTETLRPARRRRPAGGGRPARRRRRQRHRGRGRCGGIGPRPGLRLRATASESRAETGSTAVTAVGDPSGAPVRSYLPGDWFGIVGERAVVILPPTEKPRVAALWELVDGGAGFDVTLDALISGGLRELSAFVLVSTGEGETRVVIRGPARAEFQVDGETVQLEGSNATTWVERSMSEVERMSIVLHDDELDRRAAVVRRGRRAVPHLAARRGAGPQGPDELAEEPAYEREFPLLAAEAPAETDADDEYEEEYDEVAPVRSPEPPAWTPEPPTLPPPPPPAPVLPPMPDSPFTDETRPRRAHCRRRLGAAAGRAARHPRAAAGTGRHRAGGPAADLERRRGRRGPGRRDRAGARGAAVQRHRAAAAGHGAEPAPRDLLDPHRGPARAPAPTTAPPS